MTALAHPTRLQIIAVLRKKEMSVQQMIQSLKFSRSNLSEHLRLLEDWRILDSRLEGGQVFYRVLDKKILKLIDLMQNIFCPSKQQERPPGG
ncbi:MAG: ArsR family transcriptional regulator [Candidatus Manganitrophaceae bacterium]|nr:MAG: ArsR family transcriptional regulator [Candidatus Manganitrophaceae bacterium]